MYRLADNVFSCLANSRIVFLDLERNRYSCLSARYTQDATRILAGSPSCCPYLPCSNRSAVDDDIGQLLQALTSAGLMVRRDAREDDSETPPDIAIPEISLDDLCNSPAKHRPIRFWPEFYRSAFKSSWKLRYWPMKRTVSGVAERRKREAKVGTENVTSLSELASAFNSLRPYYKQDGRCLFNSLCLIDFLAHFDHFPAWVFGVKTEPFGAHCWVQHDSCVLSDSVENVRRFTPIMSA